MPVVFKGFTFVFWRAIAKQRCSEHAPGCTSNLSSGLETIDCLTKKCCVVIDEPTLSTNNNSLHRSWVSLKQKPFALLFFPRLSFCLLFFTREQTEKKRGSAHTMLVAIIGLPGSELKTAAMLEAAWTSMKTRS